MTPEDQQAFQSACKDWAVKSAGQDIGEYFFKAACAHRDAQAAQVNQQMLEALNQTQVDLTILLRSITDSLKKDKRWDGMYEVLMGWIKRNHAAIAAAEKLNHS